VPTIGEVSGQPQIVLCINHVSSFAFLTTPDIYQVINIHMNSMRTWINILEDQPQQHDGFLLEFGDKILVETHVTEITPQGEYVLHADETLMYILETLGMLDTVTEAQYHGRTVPLNKPMRGDQKKFKVYVKDPKTGNIKKVNFGHGGKTARRAGQKTMRIRKSNPAARKNFRARHHCENPGPKTSARYWSCRAW
jgi:hypothetical protein